LRLRGDGLAALSGILLALSFPKFGHWAVAWVALVPLLVALAASGGAHAFRLGYVTGAVSSIGILYWTSFVVVRYGGLSLPVGVAVMVLLAMAVALFPSVFAWVVGRGIAAFGPSALLLAPAVWVATELLRNRTFFRFPWCLLGYSQQPNILFIQTARFGAVYAVSFLVAGAASVLAYLLVERRAGHRRLAVLGLAVVLGFVVADGALELSRPIPEAGRERVALVQARILQEEKWDEARAIANVGEHLDLTRRAAGGGARLVVWPESSLPDFFDEGPPVARNLRNLAREAELYLLFGNDDREEDGNGGVRVFVGAKMLSPAGDLAYRYHKIRLVPFGEYVPMQPILTLGGRVAAKLVQQVADFTPGHELSLASVDGHSAGAFICYEAIFPELVRGFAAGGAELLVNITNDAWYGRTSAPHQHLAMAAFRAVENGKYLVRAANTGITAVIDPRGRILEQTPLFERTVLVRDVPWVRGETFYVRHGDVFAWICLAVAVALTLATFTARTPRLRAAE
jgi:apolipoprotein N-acyltransferase